MNNKWSLFIGKLNKSRKYVNAFIQDQNLRISSYTGSSEQDSDIIDERLQEFNVVIRAKIRNERC